jgi:hypothetical protein
MRKCGEGSEGGRGGGNNMRWSRPGPDAVRKEATTASRPTMRAPLEMAPRQATQSDLGLLSIGYSVRVVFLFLATSSFHRIEPATSSFHRIEPSELRLEHSRASAHPAHFGLPLRRVDPVAPPPYPASFPYIITSPSTHKTLAPHRLAPPPPAFSSSPPEQITR